MRSAEELALAVQNEEMEFDDALLEYLSEHHPERLEDTSFFIVMSITIGYAAMGKWEKDIPFSDNEQMTVKEVIDMFGLGPFVERENVNIIWHGKPCPKEHLAKVEAELAGLLGKMLDSPQQLISHWISLGNGGAVTAWGETGDDAFHAEFHLAPLKERADKALFDRIQSVSRTRNGQKEDNIMQDPTETIRRERLAEINVVPGSREALEAQYGQVWDTQELGRDFEVIGFMAPLVVVRRRSDGKKGSLEFQHSPRIYFSWQPHTTD